MKKKKILLIILAVVFFLTALTLYLNRVVFPTQLKKFAVKQAETFLKRKVEIESLRFSWVKGFIIDKVKVYQKDSEQVFLQAERVSLGVIFIPGLKQQRVTIPFINIEEPSLSLVHSGTDQWNFSDLLGPSAPQPSAAVSAPSAPQEKPSAFSVSVTGINIIDGKVRIDDVSGEKPSTELLEHVDLKIGLSFNGIAFNARLSIPQKRGSLSAQGNYQPANQNLQAQVQIKNINPADYASLYNVSSLLKGLDFKNGLIEALDVNVNYSKDSISGGGDIAVKNLDLEFNGQSFKGNLEAAIAQIKLNKDSLVLDGDFNLKNLSAAISEDHVIKGSIALNQIKAQRSKDGTQVLGTVTASDVGIQWGTQSFQGSAVIKPLTLNFKSENDIDLSAGVQIDHANMVIDPQKTFKGTLTVNSLKLRLSNQKDIDAKGRISITDMDMTLAEGVHVSGSMELPAVTVGFNNGIWALKTEGEMNNWQINLGQDKTVVGESNFSVNAIYPVSDPQKLQYDGTFSLHSAEAKGFTCGPIPCGDLKEINLDAKFQTDQFKIKMLTLTALGSSVKAAGTIMSFNAPVFDVEAGTDKIDLALLKDILPDIFKTYGLSTSGEASFNVQFQGLAADPLSGKINTKIELKNAAVASSTFNQSASNISGKVEGTLGTLSWENFTGTYMGSTYTLTGRLTDFKNPHVTTSLDGKDVQLKTELAKQGNILTIKALDGKYFNITFGTSGTVDLSGPPVLDLNSKVSLHLEDVPALLAPDQRKLLEPLKPNGAVNIEASIKGKAADWRNWVASGKISSDLVTVMGYSINNLSLNLTEAGQKISDLTVDAAVYDGKVHAVASGDLSDAAMPFDLALNVDGLDLHKLKMDIPSLKSEEINGKFYLTSINKGKLTDLKNIQGKGSLAIREGFLTEFKLFKGLLSILNDVMHIGQLTITDVEGNFEVAGQKWTTENLRLKSPTIVLLTQGWVNFDQDCDLNVTVDTTSGIVPPIAIDVLQTLKIRVYDKLGNPKFDRKISVPQVINTLIKNLPIFAK